MRLTHGNELFPDIQWEWEGEDSETIGKSQLSLIAGITSEQHPLGDATMGGADDARTLLNAQLIEILGDLEGVDGYVAHDKPHVVDRVRRGDSTLAKRRQKAGGTFRLVAHTTADIQIEWIQLKAQSGVYGSAAEFLRDFARLRHNIDVANVHARQCAKLLFEAAEEQVAKRSQHLVKLTKQVKCDESEYSKAEIEMQKQLQLGDGEQAKKLGNEKQDGNGVQPSKNLMHESGAHNDDDGNQVKKMEKGKVGNGKGVEAGPQCGETLEVYWHADDKWHRGEVDEINGDGTYARMALDDERVEWVKLRERYWRRPEPVRKGVDTLESG